MGRSPPPFFPGAGRTPAREMRRFARPGRGRHDLGGLCGHGAGTSRGRESSGEDLTARSTALTRPAWSANSADAKTASAQFCWRCGELIRQGDRYYGTSGYKVFGGCALAGCRGRAESEGSQRWVRSHFAAGQAKP
ncbi:unnamed protein product [Effrenium voratum]|nr:unnamed protein product [Effrenium voratum]